MPKLTETTNDRKKKKPQLVLNTAPTAPNGPLHVEAAHEPLLRSGETGPLPTFNGGTQWVAQAQLNYPQTYAPTQGILSVAPVAEVKPLKVAVLGTAPSSRMLAPFDDKSWTIWACSPGNMNVTPRFDAWFEIHGNLLWAEHKHYGEPYIEWLRKQTCPIYMQEAQMHGIPNAVAYPKEAMIKEFGPDFFTSSFSWMMAMAISMGAVEIALYGVDMASREEYILQRPGFYFFRHMARVRGIKVFAPNESDIMQSPGLYGYSDVQPFARKLHARRAEVRGRIQQMETEKARLIENILYLKGADEDIDYTLSIWSGVQDNSAGT